MISNGFAYGEGRDEDGGKQGMFFVRRGNSVQWFFTREEARKRAIIMNGIRLVTKSKDGQS